MIKIAIGAAVVALLGVIAYAYSQQGAPTVTATGSALPPVLTPTTGARAPRARSTGSSGARDMVTTPSKPRSSTSRQNVSR